MCPPNSMIWLTTVFGGFITKITKLIWEAQTIRVIRGKEANKKHTQPNKLKRNSILNCQHTNIETRHTLKQTNVISKIVTRTKQNKTKQKENNIAEIMS